MDNSTENRNRDVSYGGTSYQAEYQRLNEPKKSVLPSVYTVVSGIGFISAIVMVVMALVSLGSSLM